jgi:predicted Zn-dependent protease
MTTPKAQEQSVSPAKKLFPQEDMYILFALRAEQINDYGAASKLFNQLYKKSGRKNYLYRSLENDLVAKKSQRVIKRVDDLTQGSFDDFKLVRYKIIALIELQKYTKAQELALKLLEHSQLQEDYVLVANLYIQFKEYDTALKYLESAYIQNYDEMVLDKMAIVLYVNLHRTKDAIAQLETHSRVYGCSELICKRLLGIYSNENNIEGLLSVYLRLYDRQKDELTAKKIIQIYAYRQDYDALIEFLEKSNADDSTLLQLYSIKKEYTKGYKLADKLYKESSDVKYLAQSAIYEYEANPNSLDKELLNRIIKKLKETVKTDASPLYLNYLGYILIDHDIDVEQGMQYIHRVLKLQPNSAYYLDSLAWGYYKLGNCKKAKKIIDKVVTLEGGDDPEVLSHLKEIQKCLKNTKVKK